MSRYLFIRLICILIFLFQTGFIQAQRNPFTELIRITNLPRAGDSLVKQQVDYIDPGIAGTNITWDFRKVNPVNDYYNILYRITTPDSIRMAGIEHGTIYSFMVKGDSLLHTGYENSTTIMNYSSPELRLKFPVRYGDIVSSDFEGEGEYCHIITLHVSGKTTITADATGTLITPLGLLFKNVLRVKSLREYLQTGLDSLTMKLESYAWYSPGHRYPVFETVKTVTKKTGKRETEHKVASFFYPPPEKAFLLADTSNWTKQELPVELNSTEPLLINIKLIPNPVQSWLNIEYNLTSDVVISFKIFDNNGILRFSLPEALKEAGNYSEKINMNGFNPGIYLINVFVDNMVKVIKVIKI